MADGRKRQRRRFQFSTENLSNRKKGFRFSETVILEEGLTRRRKRFSPMESGVVEEMFDAMAELLGLVALGLGFSMKTQPSRTRENIKDNKIKRQKREHAARIRQKDNDELETKKNNGLTFESLILGRAAWKMIKLRINDNPLQLRSLKTAAQVWVKLAISS